ncbi:unnamed protein product, partial [marine sediment metagenome]
MATTCEKIIAASIALFVAGLLCIAAWGCVPRHR